MSIDTWKFHDAACELETQEIQCGLKESGVFWRSNSQGIDGMYSHLHLMT